MDIRLIGARFLHQDDQKAAAAGRFLVLTRGGRLMGFYVQYFADSNFRTLITGRLMRGGRLIVLKEVRL